MQKHFFLLAIALVSITSAYAQLPPNGDFENWTNQGTHDDPDGWATSNMFSAAFGVTPVTKSTDAASGTYSMRLENMLLPTNDTATGLAVIGMGLIPSAPALPYTASLPDSFTGHFKFLPNGADTLLIAAVLTQWDPVNNKQIEVGGAGMVVTDTVATWTRFAAPYTPNPTNGSLTPDSINFIIMMLGDGQTPVLGSVTYVDNLALVTSGGGGTPSAPSNLTANPLKTSANGGIELSWTDNSNNELGFIVQRSTDGNTWNNIDSVPTNATNFTDQGLADGTQYYYQVLSYNASGNSAPSNTVNATTTVGIADEWLRNGLLVYPNPSTGIFQLELSTIEPVSVNVFDVSGRLLYALPYEANGQLPKLLDLSHLSNGIYLLHVSTSTSQTIRRVGIAK